MVATVIAWAFGIGFLLVASSEGRFERVAGRTVRAQFKLQTRLPGWGKPSEHTFMRTSRFVMLGVGALLVVLAVLATWSLAN